jgi:Tfp pilus assembly protein PilP
MGWLTINLSSLDWRRPWLWPHSLQQVSFVCAAIVGVLLLSPWCLHSWQAWDDALEAQAKLTVQQASTQSLRLQVTQWQQTQNQRPVPLANPAALTQLAQRQGLQLSHLAQDKPQHNPVLNALHMQVLPVHVKVQGSWDGWLNWLAQWPDAAPGVTVSSLELKADPRGGISAHVLAVAPQSTAVDDVFELASVNADESASVDPFSAQTWASTQRAHAEQHPSYARLVAPELLRPRDVLEVYPRERLQYVGHIGSKGNVEALVKVLPPAGAQKDVAMTTVHRVRVGHHVGQDFGKVLAVNADQLVVQELALSPSGEWYTREVRLPLHEAVP